MTPMAMSLQKDVSGFVLNNLSSLPDDLQNQAVIQFNNIKKKPGTATVLAIFGFQYIYLQKWLLFILYLITMGGFCIWWFFGIFTAAGKARKINDEILAQIISHLKQSLSSRNVNQPLPVQSTSVQLTTDNSASKSSVADILLDFDRNYSGKKSKNIFVGPAITQGEVERAKKKYAHLFSEIEKPLLVLNKKSLFSAQGTGVLITDKQIYVGTVKDSFGASMQMKCNPNVLQYSQIKTLLVGDHDSAYGTAYIGHKLMLNGVSIGLLRMGSDMTYDDNAIEYLNSLFQHLQSKQIFA